MKHDESGAVQVVEAILVAVLVATTLIFFALSQRPNIPSTSPQADLAQVAQDALDVLQGGTPGSSQDKIASWVQANVTGPAMDPPPTCTPNAQIADLVPEGMQYRLYASHVSVRYEIACSVDQLPGSGAQSGATFVVDNDPAVTLYLVELVVWDVF